MEQGKKSKPPNIDNNPFFVFGGLAFSIVVFIAVLRVGNWFKEEGAPYLGQKVDAVFTFITWFFTAPL